MAVYSGSAGIAQLREKIKQKSKMLVGESAEKIAIYMIDESPLGVEVYPTTQGPIYNDVGDFKNSWNVAFGTPDPSIRDADSAGTAAVADAMSMSNNYNFEDSAFVTNNVEHADNVDHLGWMPVPEYGWKGKGSYSVMSKGTPTAKAILEAVAEKVSKL